MKRFLMFALGLTLIACQSGCETWHKVVGAELAGIDVHWFLY